MGQTFFVRTTPTEGNELWATDGTPGGEHLVKDVRPGAQGSFPSDLFAVGDRLYFLADDGVHGSELWTSDGTSAGTVFVKDITSGAASSTHFDNFTAYGGAFYFTVNDGVHGKQLWRSDGTAGGTSILKEIGGPTGVSADYYQTAPNNLTVSDGKLFFTARDSANTDHLWVSDGTSAGTTQITSMYVDSGLNPSYGPTVAALNGGVLFVGYDTDHGTELWRTDGTAAGTTLVKDIVSGATSSAPGQFTVIGGEAYFTTKDASGQKQLWKSDGTAAGTVRVGTGTFQLAEGLTAVGNKLFFAGYAGSESSIQLWVSDGTAAGTKSLAVPYAASTGVSFHGQLYFPSKDAAHSTELWASDGTAAGTRLVADLVPGNLSSVPLQLTVAGDQLVFSAVDKNGVDQVWTSDGTAAGTHAIASVEPTSDAARRTSLIDVGGKLYFRAIGASLTGDLWSSDGTSAGTHSVLPIGTSTYFGFVHDLASAGGLIYTVRTDVPYSFWSIDGTTGQAVKLLDLDPTVRADTQEPQEFTDVGGKMFFAYDDGVHGNELWKSDGTKAGTVLVEDINTGSAGSIVAQHRFGGDFSLTAVGSGLFFVADDGTHGRELWKSDGTGAGTVLVKDIGPGTTENGPEYLAAVGKTLFFAADDGVHGNELWKSNGTPAGTVMVTDAAGSDSLNPRDLTAVNGLLFFTGHDGRGTELWVSDGTAAGTKIVKDINSGAADAYPEHLTAVGSKLFFTADDGTHGRELWLSDGTVAGTKLVKDIATQIDGQGSFPGDFAVLGSKLLFLANDGTHGRELWISDGTTAGTTLVKDLTPGSASTDILEPTVSGGALYFTANGQLWRSDGTATGTVVVAGPLNGTEIETTVQPSSHAPTSVSLSSAVAAEFAKTGARVGTLSAVDADAGDTFIYELLDNAGGRFKLSGATLKVANGLLLDYEQAKSASVKVKVTDSQGHSLIKTLAITIKDVNPETIAGSSRNDVFVGGAKKDKLSGAAGKDTLKGGAGNDTLDGGFGKDVLKGDAGKDTFFFSTKLGSSNLDHIKDFRAVDDTIKLENTGAGLFTKLAKGNLHDDAFALVKSGKDLVGDDAHILYDKAHGALYYDPNGGSASGRVEFAVLDNHASLTLEDFLVV